MLSRTLLKLKHIHTMKMMKINLVVSEYYSSMGGYLTSIKIVASYPGRSQFFNVTRRKAGGPGR